MKKEATRIALVMPAYNEGSVIRGVIESLPAQIEIKDGLSVELCVVVVNDGSTDNTRNEVGKTNAMIINHIVNSGAGAATRSGINFALNELGAEYLITMDSDGQHSSGDVVKLTKEIVKNDSDFIIGSRLMLGNKGKMPWYKRLGNIGLGTLTFLLLGVYASDTQSGLKAMNRDAAKKIKFHSNNYAFCSEMIWRAHQARLRIKEIPIESIYTEYSMSRGQKNLSGALDISKQLIKRRIMDLVNG